MSRKRPRDVAGPSLIEVLRGRLQGRAVALLCCGEAHEEAVDLTRQGAVLAPRYGWRRVRGAFDASRAVAQRRGVGLAAARRWPGAGRGAPGAPGAHRPALRAGGAAHGGPRRGLPPRGPR